MTKIKKIRKLSMGTGLLGKKILDNLDPHYERFSDYMETLNEKEQLIGVYLYCVKILASLDDETRIRALNNLQKTKWKKIK